ncbi:MAG: ATP-binding protein [Cyanobacteria bacterium P01_F01_bin.53]
MTAQILVVDDEPDVESLISFKFRREIRQEKYAFSFASNGAEAYEKVVAAATNEADIDLVMTDLNMPVMDGLELLSQLNALTQTPRTVVVSAYSDMDNIRAAMNRGAFDFLTKPLNFQDLVVTLEKTLAAVEADRQQRLQLKQTQMQLMQSDKMSSLGQMMASVAHEINNPVNFLVGNLEPAKEYIHDLLRLTALYRDHVAEPSPAIESCIQEIDLDFLRADLPRLFTSLEMGTLLIRELSLSLRNFSRVDAAQKQVVDIHEGIKSTQVILNSRLKAKQERPAIELIRDYGELPEVSCYPGQLNQVVMNLLANAIDAIEEQTQGRTYEEIEASPNTIRICTEVINDDWVRIAIADNGPGMTEDTLAKLFEPFFTTKPIGKGTGLGLAISQQIIVEKHGGRLFCESTLGEGTRFMIELPVDA